MYNEKRSEVSLKPYCNFFPAYLDWQYSDRDTAKPNPCQSCQRNSCFNDAQCGTVKA
ncbi:hypothetical protein SAMN02745220_04659 [Desulfopila aestuarii DSM 18488]|uniref:Uncharacterized protein n=1 Tax=Desulfopila aestuarii DSM 18488 TaxID=1121416 RepID=A0A1M7YJ46_9BACT|nr:hypothetical protein SAMN02745220_04659 [Desulfopila aestuarii DSM 18488]